jgi:hypothetical protein
MIISTFDLMKKPKFCQSHDQQIFWPLVLISRNSFSWPPVPYKVTNTWRFLIFKLGNAIFFKPICFDIKVLKVNFTMLRIAWNQPANFVTTRMVFKVNMDLLLKLFLLVITYNWKFILTEFFVTEFEWQKKIETVL